MRGWALLLLVGCPNIDAPNNSADAEDRVFEVPKGATASGLIDDLIAAGLVDSPWKAKLFLKQRDASCIKAGRHTVRGGMSFNELIDALCAPPLPEDVPFAVVEGWRIADIDAAIAEKGWAPAGAYAQLATSKGVALPFEITSPSLEGYLYPETYMIVPERFDAKQLIERQLATFQERFLSKHPEGFGDKDLHQVVVVASMLEREEPKVENRPLVSGIIWKRLANNWQLGIDATSHYKLAIWDDRPGLLAALKDAADPYNTRLRQGLPPGAIGNPSAASLEAALKPQASEFWYYLHDGQGNIHPAVDAAGHEANRAKFGVY